MTLRLSVLAGLAALALASPAAQAADDSTVDLELVLAVDVSRSMDTDEQELQRAGYVSAFRHPEVVQAIRRGMIGKIAVTYIEWAGPQFQSVVVPWTKISTQGESEAFAARLDAAPLTREFGTAISGGLLFASSQFPFSGEKGERRVIDVSGDGPNNMGPPVLEARERVLAEGITINGLPLVLKTATSVTAYGIPNLDIYYEDCVIGGPGAFMVTVNSLDGFDDAVRRKLVLEIASVPPLLHRAAEVMREPRIDCLIGEKAREFWLDR